MAQKCPACRVNPKSHSFDHIATTPNGTRIFYTAPVLSEEPETPQKVVNLKIHLSEALATPWVWVMDCSKMQSRHRSSLHFIRVISDVLSKEHMGVLQNIVILNADVWVQWIGTVIQTFSGGDTVMSRVTFSNNILGDFMKLRMPMPVIHAVLVRNQSLSTLDQQ